MQVAIQVWPIIFEGYEMQCNVKHELQLFFLLFTCWFFFCDPDFFLGTPIPGYRGFRRPVAVSVLVQHLLNCFTSVKAFVVPRTNKNYMCTDFVLFYHCIAGSAEKFTNRGILSFKSFKHGVGSFTQTSALTAGEKRKLKVSVAGKTCPIVHISD